MRWSPDGNLLAKQVLMPLSVAIWEENDGEFVCVSTLSVHESEVKSASWRSASGMFIATCSRDKTVAIWEVMPQNEFDCLSILAGHSRDVKMVQWHPTVDILFSCGYDNAIKVWTEDDGDWCCDQTIDVDDRSSLYLFSIRMYMEHPFEMEKRTFAPFDSHYLGLSYSAKVICQELFPSHSCFSSSGHTSTVWALSFNASGEKMVSCSDDLTIKIWTADAEKLYVGEEYVPWTLLCSLSGHHDRTIFSVNWSRSGIICTGAADNSICLFVECEDDSNDGPTYRLLLKKAKAHDMDANAVQWSHGETSRLASASDDGTIKIWELGPTVRVQ